MLTVGQRLLSVQPGRVSEYIQPKMLPDAPPLQPTTHEKPDVTVVFGRIPAPVINTVVIIESADRTVAAGVPPRARRRLLDALRSAGFQVTVEQRWFASGDSDVRPWP